MYDQLQILQILDFIYQSPVACELSIICTDNYLGHCSLSEMLALEKYNKKVKDKVEILKEIDTVWHGAREFYVRDCNSYVLEFSTMQV